MRRIALLASLIATVVGLAASPTAIAETITIEGPTGPLSGTRIAAGDGPMAIIIPGSGPVDRDGNGPTVGLATDAYRLLAEALAAEGVGTVRIDKRGFFGSAAAAPNPEDVTIAGYADDVLAWAEAVRRDGQACVWLVGHSEGALVALKSAERAPERLCGLVLLTAPGRPIGALMRVQFAANPATAPFSAALDRVIAEIEAGRPVAPEAIPPQVAPLFRPGLQPFMRDLFSHDPGALAAAFDGPILSISGGRDAQVGPEDAARLAAHQPALESVTLPQMTHVLKLAETDAAAMATYSEPGLPLHAALAPTIARFLARHASEPDRGAPQ